MHWTARRVEGSKNGIPDMVNDLIRSVIFHEPHEELDESGDDGGATDRGVGDRGAANGGDNGAGGGEVDDLPTVKH